MEINAISQMRRTAQTTRSEEKKLTVPEASDTESKVDRLSVTERAVETLLEQSQRLTNLLQQDEEEKKPAIWDMVDGASGEDGDDESDMLGEQLKTMERCQKIAARIMRGDKVPPQDEQYLMQNDPDGYKLALAMRTPKKKPKEWDSVLKDEEKESSEGSEETGETASCGEVEGTSEGASDAGCGDAAASGE